jgi:putative Holliday junction resolvase
MGIDYGSKRVGVAVSDESNSFALPRKTLQNNPSLFDELNTIICDVEPEAIILGESKNFQGEDNKIMKDIRAFKEKLENQFARPVIFEPEFLTSHQAVQFQGKNAEIDASAAALILQSYLDRLKNSLK